MLMQKYAKICCHKTTWAIILMTSIHLLEASGAPAFTLQQGGWITVHKRQFFLKVQLGAVHITQLHLHSLELNLVFFSTSWWSGLAT